MKPPLSKRCPPGLTDDERSDFFERQAEFDAVLKAEGFVDLESGSDMSDFDGSTFSGGEDFDPSFDDNQPGPVKHLVKNGKPCRDVIAITPKRNGRKRRPHRSLEAFGDAVHEHQSEFGAEPGQQLGLGATADYEFWRRVGHAVHDVPPEHEHSGFLIDLAESGNLAEAAKTHGLSRTTARRVFRDLLFRCGLKKSQPARGPAQWLT